MTLPHRALQAVSRPRALTILLALAALSALLSVYASSRLACALWVAAAIVGTLSAGVGIGGRLAGATRYAGTARRCAPSTPAPLEY